MRFIVRALILGGATGFEQLAAVGSWVVKVLGAGHMDFVDWGNAGPERTQYFVFLLLFRTVNCFAFAYNI